LPGLNATLAVPDWPRLLGMPSARAVLRARPEDFEVEEVARIHPQGEGAHLWLWVEKRGENTDWVAGRLAQAAGCATRDVGYAGMKDRHAVTRQWFSVPAQGAAELPWADWRIDGVRLLDARRHPRKLQRGALAGNRFRIVLREWRGEPVDLAARLERIVTSGLPNYFGPQRFGHDGLNVRRGVQWLRDGGRLSRAKRSIYLSAVRSFLFNQVLARRVVADCWNRLLPGEVAMLDGTRSVFTCDAIDPDLQWRCREFDLHPSGPLPGRGGLQPGQEAGALEQSALAPYAELKSALARAGLEADRRSLRVKAAGLAWNLEADRLELAFELPAGAYATALVRELVSEVQ
jgi:tRNA pseudouridine13 synthase